MEKICNYDACTGCRACVHVCPKQAITMKEDKFGVLLPAIDYEKCVNCGLCQKVCQVNTDNKTEKVKKCYAVWTKEKLDRELSSSGGLSTGFGRTIVRNGGIVFGAAYNDKFQLQISVAETEEEVSAFRGSKYVQSSTADSYPAVKKYLEQDKKVLFVGTPCQIMGLRNYLRKDYENLLLVDIICHGVPPFKHLEEHVRRLCPGKIISKVSFRGEHNFKLAVYQNDELLYCKNRFEDSYFTAFLEGLNYRESCYACQYAKEERCSDITIGDFWGLKREEMQQSYDGRISVALLNTDKGICFFESIKDNFYYEERPIVEAIEGNGQLQKPTRVHPKRKIFLEMYVQEGLEAAYRKAGIVKKVNKEKIKNTVMWKALRKIVHAIK